MPTTRRSFLKACVASGSAGMLGWEGCVSESGDDAVYPGWRPGELDLHFVYIYASSMRIGEFRCPAT